MSIVPDPPAPAGKDEALRLATGAPSSTPSGSALTQPDAGKTSFADLDIWDLRKHLREKEEELERQDIIRQLMGGAPKPAEPPAYDTVSTRAERLKNRVPHLAKLGQDGALYLQFDDLSAIFEDLVYHRAGGEDFQEKFGLLLALRAQKQAVETARALNGLQTAEELRSRLARKEMEKAKAKYADPFAPPETGRAHT